MNRTRAFLLVILTVLALAAPTGTAARAAGCPSEWRQFRFGPARTGENPCESLLSRATVAQGLTVAWQGDTGTFGTSFSSSPAVVLGHVFVGSSDDGVWAFDAITGALEWQAPLGEALSSPAVAGGMVYVGLGSGGLVALEADTGLVAWSAPTAPIDSSPAVSRGRVWIGAEDGTVHAFDADSGDPLWSTPTGGAIHSSPAVRDGALYVGSDDGSVYALNATTGAVNWSTPTGFPVRSTPAVSKRLVYAGSSATLFALEKGTGAVQWSRSQPSWFIRGSPALDGSLVYQVWDNLSNSDRGALFALSASRGRIEWAHVIGENFYQSSPAVANGVVYVGALVLEGEADRFYAVSAESGRELWSYFLDCCAGAGFGQPAVAHGHVYVNTANDDLYAFGLSAPLRHSRRHNLQTRGDF